MRCWFFHKFAKWVDHRVSMFNINQGKRTDYEEIVQIRECLKCGLKQKRKYG